MTSECRGVTTGAGPRHYPQDPCDNIQMLKSRYSFSTISAYICELRSVTEVHMFIPSQLLSRHITSVKLRGAQVPLAVLASAQSPHARLRVAYIYFHMSRASHLQWWTQLISGLGVNIRHKFLFHSVRIDRFLSSSDLLDIWNR